MPYKLYYTNNLQNRCHDISFYLNKLYLKKNLIEKFIKFFLRMETANQSELYVLLLYK